MLITVFTVFAFYKSGHPLAGCVADTGSLNEGSVQFVLRDVART